MLSQTASTHSFSWSDWGLSACSFFSFLSRCLSSFGLPVCIFCVPPAVSPPVCLCTLSVRWCSWCWRASSSLVQKCLKDLGLDCQSVFRGGCLFWSFVQEGKPLTVVVGGTVCVVSVRAAGYDGNSFICLFPVPAVSACPARRMQHASTWGFLHACSAKLSLLPTKTAGSECISAAWFSATICRFVCVSECLCHVVNIMCSKMLGIQAFIMKILTRPHAWCMWLHFKFCKQKYLKRSKSHTPPSFKYYKQMQQYQEG